MALDTTSLPSRRALLAGSVAGLAALVAQAFGRPAPVGATHGDVHLGKFNVATTSTAIRNMSAGDTAFLGFGDGSGTGVYGRSDTGNGVRGFSDSGTGVSGGSEFGFGVRGSSEFGTGIYGESDRSVGVFGRSLGIGQHSIYGLKEGIGTAVWGEIDNATSGWGAVRGQTNGTGPGVIGVNRANGIGIMGLATGNGAGVNGESNNGRGGSFKGKLAQVRLNPSTAASHPASGARGDLFVDASTRLWFCRGGTTWVRLA